jgi:methionyl-tRNA formyltransferase
MGTPDFAVPTLKALINSKHKVVAIFTQKPKPKGRGLEVTSSPIQIVAEEAKIPVYSPTTLKTEESFKMIDEIAADIIVVAAYGFIIPANILACKKYGCINLHPSRLPRFRGAAPLQHTIIEGDKESSICVIQMDAFMDTGDILLQKDFTLPPRPQLKWLHDYCAQEGAKMIVQTIDNIDSLKPAKQSVEGVKLAGKLRKEDGLIDFQMDAFEIDCRIRGTSAWPVSYFKSNIGDIKIIDAEPVILDHQESPGSMIDGQLLIACKKNALKINKLQAPGKKPLDSKDFFNGHRDFRIE